MRKAMVAAGLAGVGLAGLALAAAGGMAGGRGSGFVLLPAGQGGAAAPAVQATSTPAAAPEGFVTRDGRTIVDSYICVFRRGAVGRGAERAEANRAAQAEGGRVGHVYGHALQGFSIHISERGVAQMQARNPRIDYCEQDQIATIIDPVEALAKPGGGGGGTPAQQTPLGIGRVGGGISGATATAWVIDTGIDLTHPDLRLAASGHVNFVPRESSPDDLNGHGSHVAGTIAAIDNEIGVIGVAAGAQVVAVRVLNRRGSGAYSDVIAGVNHVAALGRPGDVANMSLGGPPSDALDAAVENTASQPGIRFALAAGNESDDANSHSPARAEGQNIYTIAAFSAVSGNWASFSNFGKPPVDYAEPGVSVYSTWKDGGYNTISGTSMAAPHMAGLLLLGSPRDGGTVQRVPGDSYVIGVR